MEFIQHKNSNHNIVEIISNETMINSEQDILDLIVDVEYKFDSKVIILYRKNLNEDFFILKTGLAGAILQKLVNYQVRMGIIGNFEDIDSKNFHDFVFECNKNKQAVFTPDVQSAIELLK